MDERDPLDDLIIKSGQIQGEQRRLLRDMLAPFAGIDIESGLVQLKETADALNSRHRILVYLLARVALAAKAAGSTPAATFQREASPKEIERDTGLPGGTVRPALKQLSEAHLVHRSGDKYTVLPGGFKRAHAELAPHFDRAGANDAPGSECEAG